VLIALLSLLRKMLLVCSLGIYAENASLLVDSGDSSDSAISSDSDSSDF
jgi:hypothetical protein